MYNFFLKKNILLIILTLLWVSCSKNVDDFTEKAHPDYPNLTEEVIKNRTLLFNVLSHFGFTHYPTEWWHFDYQNWQQYPMMDLLFEELK